ncbi:MAG: hypothetical protein J3R72DRAFT_36197 [Linnemannia gamsii]|nr:MAG: hypothetical protein J3R72DRAFT_36197 [Linnemannia gamsii]
MGEFRQCKGRKDETLRHGTKTSAFFSCHLTFLFSFFLFSFYWPPHLVSLSLSLSLSLSHTHTHTHTYIYTFFPVCKYDRASNTFSVPLLSTIFFAHYFLIPQSSNVCAYLAVYHVLSFRRFSFFC